MVFTRPELLRGELWIITWTLLSKIPGGTCAVFPHPRAENFSGAAAETLPFSRRELHTFHRFVHMAQDHILLADTVVVLLHFGEPSLTERSLRAVRAHYPETKAPFVLLVENGIRFPMPTDITGVQSLALPDNRGYGAGNNAGLRVALARGANFVVFVNNDVVLSPGTLEAMRRAATRPGVGLVGAPLLEPAGCVYGGGTVSWWRLRSELTRTPVLGEQLDYIHGACLGMTRHCAEQVGMFREDFFLYWEDVEYGLRARRAGVGLAVADCPPLVHPSTPTDAPEKTYYLVRNAIQLATEMAPLPARWWIRLVTPLRAVAARVRRKPSVARALTDARRGRSGPFAP